MTKLSVNINKIATLRNSRGGSVPDVLKVATDVQRFGAHGVTVHPRPDERHIRRKDVYDLRPLVYTEFNIEGYPSEYFIQLVLDVKPEQVTLVPDPPGAITSNQGWDVIKNINILIPIIQKFKVAGIRTSIFIDTNTENIRAAKDTGTDRIELFTEPYATDYLKDKVLAVSPFVKAAKVAVDCNLGINAGHDLSLENLGYFHQQVPGLLEVSIGHALISEALYLGLENTIQLYLRELK